MAYPGPGGMASTTSPPRLYQVLSAVRLDPLLLAQAVVNGLLIGGVYALVALGLSFTFGIMRIVNLSHGSLLMVGMYLSYILWAVVKVDPYLSLVIVIPAVFWLGYFLQHTCLRPLVRAETTREPVSALLVTFGLWLVLDNLALLIFGADYRPMNTSYRDASFALGGLTISAPRLYAFLVAFILTTVFNWFLSSTYTGRALRAVGQDREAARLMGMDDSKLYNVALGLSAIFAGVAGTLLTPFYFIFPSVGEAFLLKAFVIVILGGLGSIPGALLGGLLIGIFEAVVGIFTKVTHAELLLYVVFILVLRFRPAGLMGLERE